MRYLISLFKRLFKKDIKEMTLEKQYIPNKENNIHYEDISDWSGLY